MSTTRHVEIVGAGIAGLTAAAALAVRGHSVRVHERTDSLREIGAGIYLKRNGLDVLKKLGVFERLRPEAERLTAGEIRGENDTLLIARDFSGEDVFTVLRGALHEALAEAARAAGAEILTGSAVEGANADGELMLAGGRRTKADLVIGADGVRSVVRESLGLTRRCVDLPDGAIRLLIERRPHDLPGTTYEHWSREYRMGLVPCSPRDIYVFLISPAADGRRFRLPVAHGEWEALFPHLRDVIQRIEPERGHIGRHPYVTVTGWRRGKAVIIGDAAHAQPPNLGQGAGVAIANAEALAECLDRHADLQAALAEWERSRRPVSEAVQRWSHRYGALGYGWPAGAYGARASLLRTLGAFGPTRRKWGWLWRGGLDAEAPRAPAQARSELN